VSLSIQFRLPSAPVGGVASGSECRLFITRLMMARRTVSWRPIISVAIDTLPHF
jgi:hypothetical protein